MGCSTEGSVSIGWLHPLRAEHGDSRPIISPFYWDASGRATIHGPVTAAQRLMGERFFMEMLEDAPFFERFSRPRCQMIIDALGRRHVPPGVATGGPGRADEKKRFPAGKTRHARPARSTLASLGHADEDFANRGR